MTASSASMSYGGSFSVAVTMLVVVRVALRDQFSGRAAEQQATERAVSERAEMLLPDVADVVGGAGGAEGLVGFAEGQVVVDGDGHECASLRLICLAQQRSGQNIRSPLHCQPVVLLCSSDGCRRSILLT